MDRNKIDMITDFAPNEIGQLFAARNLDYSEYFHCYSSRNPLSVNDCTDHCFEGHWWAAVFAFRGDCVAMHHAADRNRREGWAWMSGYWLPEYRGRLWHPLQELVWDKARQYFERAFPHLFCVAYCHNPWANDWILHRCHFTKAARMLGGVVDHRGERQDIWLYAQREEDVGMCIEVAQCVFDGHGGIQHVGDDEWHTPAVRSGAARVFTNDC